MAQAYDYFWTAKILVAAGADKSLKNEDGHCSIDGIDGDMIGVNWIAALTSARSDNELKDADLDELTDPQDPQNCTEYGRF